MGGLAYPDERKIDDDAIGSGAENRRPPTTARIIFGGSRSRTETRIGPPPERPRRQQEVADVFSGDVTKIDEIAERLTAVPGRNQSQPDQELLRTIGSWHQSPTRGKKAAPCGASLASG